jgi:DNA-binding response OmpR family regulator
MDRIVGLEMEADDYLPKPFEPRKLLVLIKAILRSKGPEAATSGQLMLFGSLGIDRDARRGSVKGQVCELTSDQFDLLVAMAERAGRVLTLDQIMEAERGRELEAFDRSIDVQMGRIRAAMEEDAKSPQRILTVSGVGYCLHGSRTDPCHSKRWPDPGPGTCICASGCRWSWASHCSWAGSAGHGVSR